MRLIASARFALLVASLGFASLGGTGSAHADGDGLELVAAGERAVGALEPAMARGQLGASDGTAQKAELFALITFALLAHAAHRAARRRA